MKTLLRSTFIADPIDDREAHLENFRVLDASGLGFEQPEDTAIWNFVRDFVLQHHHAPDVETVQGHFERTRQDAIVDRVAALRTLKARSRGDFLRHLQDKAEDRRKVLVTRLLQETADIVTKGVEVKVSPKEKKYLQGPIDAVRFFLDGAHGIVAPAVGSRLSGDVTHDGTDFLAEYERVESDPLAGIGQFTGIRQIDEAIRGSKRHELWVHAAFTGHLKSSLMLSWAYNQAIHYGHSTLIFSLEMPYSQCRRLLYAIHSQNERFANIHAPLDYIKIRDGQLSPSEKRFLVDHVIPDFNENPNYGSILIEVADPEKIDFTVADMRSRAETLYAKTPFSTIFVDHALLVAPRHWVPSTTDRLNEVIRDCKKLAMGFNKGMGMATVLLFQISREGFRAAQKARQGGDGKSKSNNVYNVTFLSYANEAERCVVSTSNIREFERGCIPISNVSPGMEVWSSTGWKKVLNRFDNGTRPIWRLTTDRGSILDATENHRVRVVLDGQLGWKTLSNLAPNDYVVSSFGVQQWPLVWPLLPKIDVQRYEHRIMRNGDAVHVPTRLTPDIAYLLGAWDGDGKLYKDGIAYTGNRLESSVQNAITEKLSICFSGSVNVTHSPSRPGSFDIRLFGRPLKRWFEGVAGARGRVIPQAVMASPREGVTSYLKGLFDTDGWITRHGVVGIKMKRECEGFLRTVQGLMTDLGIDSHLSLGSSRIEATGKAYGWVSLRIRSRDSRARFACEVGFTEGWKADRLASFVRGSTKSTRRGDIQTYPVMGAFLSVGERCPSGPRTAIRRSIGPTNRTLGVVSRGAIERLLTYADTHKVLGEDVDFLRRLLTLQVLKVVSIENTARLEPVIDLEVEGDHEYQTGPLLSHNSADIVTATWLDEDLAKSGQVLIQCLKSRDQKPFEPFVADVFWPCRYIKTLEDPTLENVSGTAIDLLDA